VAKLNAAGSALVYSTYLAGLGTDSGSAIAIDIAGNAYIAGSTFSANFPTRNPFQAAKGAQEDAFVAKINSAGAALVYSTYLGGNAVDEGNGIAVDAAGSAYLTGYTGSTDFPLQNPIRGSNVNSVDAFVTKINPAGSALVYSTYLGGSATDYGTAIAVDSTASAYVTGIVISDDFPVVSPIDAKLATTRWTMSSLPNSIQRDPRWSTPLTWAAEAQTTPTRSRSTRPAMPKLRAGPTRATFR